MKSRMSMVTACIWLTVFAPSAWCAPADEVKSLVEQGQSAQAYDFGKLHPDELGNPSFDFYFGVAAIDVGHAGEGVLALERYLINFPASDAARLELARGYFFLGDMLGARREFEEAAKRHPPASVQATIDRYLDAIRARESRYTPSSLGYVEAGVGFDSNVNGGVGSPNITLPNFGNVVVNSTGVKSGDTYTHLAGGVQLTRPVAPGVTLFGGVQADAKWNQVNTQFSQQNYVGSGGVSYLKNDNLYRATLSYNSTFVQDTRFRDSAAVTGEWSHQASELLTYTTSLQYADLRYPGNNQVRDAGLWSAGGGLRRAFIGNMQPVLQVGLNLGRESNRRDRPDLGRDIYGLNAALAVTPAPKWALSGGLSYLNSGYTGVDSLTGVTRRDDYWAVNFSASYAYTKSLSLRSELLWADNRSNIPLYTYDRSVAELKMRYEFK